MPELTSFGGMRKQYHLHPGEIFVTSEDMVISTVLGSCVAVCFWDPIKKVAGMNHVMLPRVPADQSPTTRYGNVATFVLLEMMQEQGCRKANLLTRVFGGANGLSRTSNGAASVMQVGEKNMEVTLKVLKHLDLRISEQDTGGEIGRKILLDCKTGQVSMNFLRRFDFKEELKEVL
ncbi:MAG: chemotaxis protein CheD [bacterium]|nr:chemotaxis protein CheD [bacterium]